jgi:hypothetical protein
MQTTTEKATPGLQGPLTIQPDMKQSWVTLEQPLRLADAVQHVYQAHERDGRRDDVQIAALAGWAVCDMDRTTMALTPVPLPGARRQGPYPLRATGFRHLCARMKAPSDYIADLPAKLQLAALNWGLANRANGSGALARLAGGEVRALLSDRYAALDDRYVLDAIQEVFQQAGLEAGARIVSLATGNTTALRVTWPADAVPVKRGDVYQYGLDIANGEVGNRSQSITPMTHRVLCLNGMRSWQTEATHRLRHVGDPDRLRDAFRDAIPVALAEARGQIEQWRRATEALVDDVFADIENLRMLNLGVGETRAVAGAVLADRKLALPADTSPETLTELFKSVPDFTVADIANAITATAKAEDTDRRLQLEEAAHRYMSKKVGKVIPIDA